MCEAEVQVHPNQIPRVSLDYAKVLAKYSSTGVALGRTRGAVKMKGVSAEIFEVLRFLPTHADGNNYQ